MSSVRRLTARAVWFISVTAGAICSSQSLAQPQPPRNPELTRTNFEVGLQYTDAIGKTYTHCVADDYSVQIFWSGSEIEAATMSPHAYPVPIGSYGIFSTHTFKVPGDVAGVVVKNDNCHCSNSFDRFTL